MAIEVVSYDPAWPTAFAEIHTELKYKIAGVWSGQEGSFLLWACTSAIFGLLALKGTGEYKRW